jgi:hypothetical protein
MFRRPCQNVLISQRKFPEGGNLVFGLKWLLGEGEKCSRQGGLKEGGG